MIKFKSVIAFDNSTGRWSILNQPEPGCTMCTETQLADLLRAVADTVEAPCAYTVMSGEIH